MEKGLNFRIARIPVTISPTLLLLAVFLGLGRRSGALLAAWVGVVVVSVLVHELGHAFAFRHYGQEPRIVLAGMGGATSGTGERLSPGRDLVVSVAGPVTPVVTLVLPGLALLRSDVALSSGVEAVVADFVVANIAWSVLNLLPVLPLDGGRVAASVMGLVRGRPADRAAHQLSVVVAAAGALIGMAYGYVFSALIAGFLIAYNVGQLTSSRNQGLAGHLIRGWEALVQGDGEAGAAAARDVLDDRPSREVMTAATELLAWSRLRTDGPDGAAESLRRIPFGQAPNPLLLGAIALARSQPEAALDRFAAGYRDRAHGPHSVVAADAVARAGLVETLADRLSPGNGEGSGGDALADLSTHLHVAGHFEAAARLGERALAAGPSQPGQVAYNLACSRARAGDSTDALWWLERAADDGFADADLLDRDPDLASLRSHERFAAVKAQMRARPAARGDDPAGPPTPP